MKLRVTFGARALVGANDGLDTGVCAARYAELLHEALRRDVPEAEVDVAWSDDRAATRAEVQGAPDAWAREIERSALDLAWVVKQTQPWGG